MKELGTRVAVICEIIVSAEARICCVLSWASHGLMYKEAYQVKLKLEQYQQNSNTRPKK